MKKGDTQSQSHASAKHDRQQGVPLFMKGWYAKTKWLCQMEELIL